MASVLFDIPRVGLRRLSRRWMTLVFVLSVEQEQRFILQTLDIRLSL